MDRFLASNFDPWSIEEIAAAVALALSAPEAGRPAGLVSRVALRACLVM